MTATLGELTGVHPDIRGLPIDVLDGTGDHIGDLDMAGKAAAEVYNNWPDDEWRNAFIMGLAQHIENQVTYHRAELLALHNAAKEIVYRAGRKAVVKTYLGSVLKEVVSKVDEQQQVRVHPYYRADGTRVSGYDREQAASMAAALLAASRKPNAGQPAEFTIRHNNGKVRTERPNDGQPPKLKRGERIIQIKNLGPQSANYAASNDTFNFARVLGANAAQAGSAGSIADEMSRQGKIKYNADGSNDWFGRLESASETLHHATDNKRVQTAAAMGKYVGKYGPEASRTVGPHMRRLSYKYRGDAAPASQWTGVARAGRQQDNKGNPESVEAFQHKLALSLQMPRKEGGLDAIPSEEQEELLLNTGSTAPSHGYILNHKGEVKQQAKGKSDDHYTPFNIKDFHHLNRGSYIRSRAFGGPTTDDFATALKTGTKSFMTVSRNGIYKVEFTPQTDKNGKKIGAWAKDTANDGTHSIVGRYGKLLDAVGHGKVTDPSTGQASMLNGHGYDLALQSLKRQFPYQIKSVQYIPAADTGSSSEGIRASRLQRDTGYVRPFYTKPGDAQYGYHDPLLGPSGSFDELDAYRLGRARVLASRKRFDSEWRKVRPGESRAEWDLRMQRGPQGSPPKRTDTSQPPTTFRGGTPGSQAHLFGATGGREWGDATPSTPAGRALAPPNPDAWGKIPTKAFLGHVRALLDHVEPDPREMPDAAQLHELLQLEDDRDRQGDWDDFVDAVQNNVGDRRSDIFDIMDELSKSMRDDQTGLHLYRKTLQEAQDNDAALPDYQGKPGNDRETMEDLRNDSDYAVYLQYRKLFDKNGSYEQQKRNPSVDKNSQKFKDLENEHHQWMNTVHFQGREVPSKFAQWTTRDADYDGLTKAQWMENRIDRATGNKPRHQVTDTYIPEPEKSSTAVTPETDDREAEAAAQRYMEQQMRDLEGPGDIDGYGRDKTDLDFSG